MFLVSKQFEFDYGHRVWNQTLNQDMAGMMPNKCRNLHGHRGIVTVNLSTKHLNEQSMVTDFNHLNWFKKWVDDILDHKFIFDVNDPALCLFFSPSTLKSAQQALGTEYMNYMPDPLKTFEPALDEVAKELYGGLVLVNFNPTSENLAKFLFELVQGKLNEFGLFKLGIMLTGIEFKETPKTLAWYALGG